MVSELSRKIVDSLVKKEIILPEQQEIYLFGTEQVITTAINFATTIFLGICFGELLHALLFLVAFMILRSYSGGFHASTPLKCYIMSVFSILAALSAIKFLEYNNLICIGLISFSGAVIFCLAPVDTENKPLDEIEKIIYRKKALIIWFVQAAAACIAIPLSFSTLTVSIAAAQILTGTALVLGQAQHDAKNK